MTALNWPQRRPDRVHILLSTFFLLGK